MSTVLFLFVGGAVDYSRWNAVRTDMVESMDAASLAVAQLSDTNGALTEAQLKDYGLRFFAENFNYEDDLKAGWSIDFNLSNSAVIATCITGKLDTYLLGVAGIHELDIDKCVEITPQGAGRIELSLVLDVTGSMGWNDSSGKRKMTSLQESVTALLDVLFDGDATSDNVRIGVVPFNQHVNAGAATSWADSWGDQNAEAVYHGARFFHVDNTGTVDASIPVNHYNLFDSDPNNSWGGCLEARPYPLDELDTIPGDAITAGFISDAIANLPADTTADNTTKNAFINAPAINADLTLGQLADADNSRWVPVFMGDEPDCSYSACNYSQSGTTNGYNWHGYWYDDPDWDSVLPVNESSYYNRSYIRDYRYTRYDEGEAFEKYLPVASYFRDVVTGATVDLDYKAWLDKYTAISLGRQEYISRTGYVGWWNPATQQYDHKYDLPKSGGGPNPDDCPDPILPLTDTRSDVENMVNALVPDGGTNIPIGAVWGWRAVSADAPFTEAIGDGENGPDGTTFDDWQKAVVIMTDGNNDFADRSTHWGSAISAYGYEVEERMGRDIDQADDGFPTMEDEADLKLLRICHRMKQEDILVYTIVFALPPGSPVEDVMKSCATAPTEPYYFSADNGDALEEAFEDIADDLVKLHVSK